MILKTWYDVALMMNDPKKWNKDARRMIKDVVQACCVLFNVSKVYLVNYVWSLSVLHSGKLNMYNSYEVKY